PDPEDIWQQTKDIIHQAHHGSLLRDKHVVVSAGGTREALDPVRFLGNRSSGKQGVALAQAAARAGAQVTLITGSMEGAAPQHDHITVVPIESTRDLLGVVLEYSCEKDVLIIAAAVADFRPATATDQKIKKDDEHSAPTIILEQTEDVLHTVIQQRAAGKTYPDTSSVLLQKLETL